MFHSDAETKMNYMNQGDMVDKAATMNPRNFSEVVAVLVTYGAGRYFLKFI